MKKKELVAQRVGGSDDKFFGITAIGMFPGMIVGLISASIVTPENPDTLEGVLLTYGSMGTTAAIAWLIGHWTTNRKYLNETVYAGKVIESEIVKKHLTWKGRMALLPLIGKLVNPRSILSKDAPYVFVGYGEDAKTPLQLDTFKDPMVSWDTLMQAELGVPVPKLLDAR